MCDLRGRLGKIIRRPEVSAKESHFPGHIGFQQGLAVLIRKNAVNLDLRLTRDRCHFPLSLASLLEARHIATQGHQVRSARRAAIPFAIDMCEPTLFLELPD